MIFCNCTLGGTKACLNCPNYVNVLGQWTIFPETPVDEIIEKFDEQGRLIERITKRSNR